MQVFDNAKTERFYGVPLASNRLFYVSFSWIFWKARCPAYITEAELAVSDASNAVTHLNLVMHD